jgi:hypothetical protein
MPWMPLVGYVANATRNDGGGILERHERTAIGAGTTHVVQRRGIGPRDRRVHGTNTTSVSSCWIRSTVGITGCSKASGSRTYRGTVASSNSSHDRPLCLVRHPAHHPDAEPPTETAADVQVRFENLNLFDVLLLRRLVPTCAAAAPVLDGTVEFGRNGTPLHLSRLAAIGVHGRVDHRRPPRPAHSLRDGLARTTAPYPPDTVDVRPIGNPGR